MRKWWLLLVLLGAWNCGGYLLFYSAGSVTRAADESKKPPQRIVCLAPSLTEIVCALGLEDRLVGVTIFSDYPPSVADKPRIGSFWQPDIEAVIAARPDLVIGLAFNQQRDTVERLRRVGCNCLGVSFENVAELPGAIGRIGVSTGAAQAARRLVDDMQSRLQAARLRAEAPNRPRVLWVVQRKPLRVAGRETFVNEIIELAGGENAIGPTVHQYPPIGAEQVIAGGIDVIIEPEMGYKGDLQRQSEDARSFWGRYRGVPAVENGRIYVIDGGPVSRLGPRICDAVDTIAALLDAWEESSL